MLTTPTIDSNKLVQSIYQLMDIADKELLSSPKGVNSYIVDKKIEAFLL